MSFLYNVTIIKLLIPSSYKWDAKPTQQLPCSFSGSLSPLVGDAVDLNKRKQRALGSATMKARTLLGWTMLNSPTHLKTDSPIWVRIPVDFRLREQADSIRPHSQAHNTTGGSWTTSKLTRGR